MRAMILLLAAALWCGDVHAAVPRTINYQGYLTNTGGTPVTSAVGMTFRLYGAASGGPELWTETQPVVSVANGVFDVVLGSVTPLALPFDVQYWLSVAVTGDGEMNPRQPVNASPYALAVDPASPTLTGNYFRQGGNAFGATAVLGTTDSQTFEVRVNNQPALRIVPATSPTGGYSPNLIGGSPSNFVHSCLDNTLACLLAPVPVGGVVAGGGAVPYYNGNRVLDNFGTIGGGFSNIVGSNDQDPNSACCATVGGGKYNHSSGLESTVSGGHQNQATSEGSTVGGGKFNAANGTYSTVPGGYFNTAESVASFAAGTRATATHAYSFVWGGDPANYTVSQADNDFTVYAPGGIRLYAGAVGAGGCLLFNGTAGWQCASDRELKENFTPLDTREVVRKLSAMPITRWTAKAVPGVAHIGPMAQDFHAAFGLGTDDKTIGSTDAHGVALAAIQGLHAMVRDREDEIAAQNARIVALERTLAELKHIVAPLLAAR